MVKNIIEINDKTFFISELMFQNIEQAAFSFFENSEC